MRGIGRTAACVLLLASSLAATEYRLYFLGGQSNMVGYGRVSELPEELAGAVDGAWIYHADPAPDGAGPDGHGLWAPLRPGHGQQFTTDGASNALSESFGVELAFARRLRELDPETPVAIVKYARGGTSIAAAAAGGFGCWDPDFEGGEGDGRGANQYDHALAAIAAASAVRDIDGDGEDDVLVPAGIAWMQGESDAAYGEEIARAYEANLRRLMDLLRAALRVDDLPVVIGRISDSAGPGEDPVWTHGTIVREAQAAYVEGDECAALVTSTDDYGHSDPWHYDSEGYLDLGRRLADELVGLGMH